MGCCGVFFGYAVVVNYGTIVPSCIIFKRTSIGADVLCPDPPENGRHYGAGCNTLLGIYPVLTCEPIFLFPTPYEALVAFGFGDDGGSLKPHLRCTQQRLMRDGRAVF